MKGQPLSPETRAKLSAALLGRVFTPEHRARISAAMTGKPKSAKHRANMTGKKRPPFSDEWLANLSAARTGKKLPPKHRAAIAAGKMGSRNPSWRGGVTPKTRLIRTSAEYAGWRTAVFERDNYTCVLCGVRGGYLQADHIKPFARYPELRFEPNNGRTLCVPCHRKTDTWGRKAQ